jgi:tryptophanyl-tRNA synthetase
MQIGDKYKRGELLTGEVKQRLIEVLVPMVEEHQRRRKDVTDEVVNKFMAIRPLKF